MNYSIVDSLFSLAQYYLLSITDSLFSVIEWATKQSIWWSASAGLSFVLLLGLAIYRSHYR